MESLCSCLVFGDNLYPRHRGKVRTKMGIRHGGFCINQVERTHGSVHHHGGDIPHSHK